MPRIAMQLKSKASPDQVRSGLLDFTSNRTKIWPGIEPSLYQVYEEGENWAEIREGNKMPGGQVWAREHYDWSDPETIKWTVVDSNFCAPGSNVSARITPGPDGGSVIDLTWNRHPTSLVGKIAAVMIFSTRGLPVSSAFRKGLANIEMSEGEG